MSFIQFHTDTHTEVLRLSKDGIWANPDIPADEAAKLVLAAIDHNIKVLVDKAVAYEREQIAQMIEDAPPLIPFAQNDHGGCTVCGFTPKMAAKTIRARGSNT